MILELVNYLAFFYNFSVEAHFMIPTRNRVAIFRQFMSKILTYQSNKTDRSSRKTGQRSRDIENRLPTLRMRLLSIVNKSYL